MKKLVFLIITIINITFTTRGNNIETLVPNWSLTDACYSCQEIDQFGNPMPMIKIGVDGYANAIAGLNGGNGTLKFIITDINTGSILNLPVSSSPYYYDTYNPPSGQGACANSSGNNNVVYRFIMPSSFFQQSTSYNITATCQDGNGGTIYPYSQSSQGSAFNEVSFTTPSFLPLSSSCNPNCCKYTFNEVPTNSQGILINNVNYGGGSHQCAVYLNYAQLNISNTNPITEIRAVLSQFSFRTTVNSCNTLNPKTSDFGSLFTLNNLLYGQQFVLLDLASQYEVSQNNYFLSIDQCQKELVYRNATGISIPYFVYALTLPRTTSLNCIEFSAILKLTITDSKCKTCELIIPINSNLLHKAEKINNKDKITFPEALKKYRNNLKIK